MSAVWVSLALIAVHILTNTGNRVDHIIDTYSASALRIMEENEISSLVVLDDGENLTGVVHLKDLLHAGIA